MPLDIALLWNVQVGEADLQMNGPDLLTDQGLVTAATISLFTDRLADPGDVIPDGSADRRGWWGDMPVDAAAQDAVAPDLTGSRLWLLDRALQTAATLANAEIYAKEALAWMITDGVAGSVEAAASFPRLGWIELAIEIDQLGALTKFAVTWQNS